MLKFMKGVRKLPLLWQLWVALMILINGVAPFFFLPEGIAIITIVSVFTGALVAVVLVETQGFTKLLAIMHGPWVPMLVAQLIAFSENDFQGNFRVWLLSSITITAVSLILDVADIILYLRGDRTDLLASR